MCIRDRNRSITCPGSYLKPPPATSNTRLRTEGERAVAFASRSRRRTARFYPGINLAADIVAAHGHTLAQVRFPEGHWRGLSARFDAWSETCLAAGMRVASFTGSCAVMI